MLVIKRRWSSFEMIVIARLVVIGGVGLTGRVVVVIEKMKPSIILKKQCH